MKKCTILLQVCARARIGSQVCLPPLCIFTFILYMCRFFYSIWICPFPIILLQPKSCLKSSDLNCDKYTPEIGLRQHPMQRVHSWITTSLGASCHGGSYRKQKLENLNVGVKFRGQGHGPFCKTSHLKIILNLQRHCMNS